MNLRISLSRWLIWGQVWEQLSATSTGMVCIERQYDDQKAALLSRSELMLLIGYHVPATRRRDLFYAKLERERQDNPSSLCIWWGDLLRYEYRDEGRPITDTA